MSQSILENTDTACSNEDLKFELVADCNADWEQGQISFVKGYIVQAEPLPKEDSDLSDDTSIDEISQKESEKDNQSDLNGSWPYKNLSEACFDFCNRQALLGDVQDCLFNVQKIFADSIKYLFAELDYFVDDEPEDIGHVVIRLVVSCDEQSAEEREELWDMWFISNINNYARSKIVLDVDRG